MTGSIDFERLPGPGARLGEYVIENLIGTGGMGAVFAARHRQLGVVRALKVQSVDTKDSHERFAREARALAKVDSHPGVVSVHEHGFGGAGGRTAFVVMDLVEGPTLAEAIKASGPLDLPRVYRIGAGIAAALDHIHAAGVVHRDLKPGNVLLRAEDDEPLLTDFGLARDSSEERLTKTGQVVGTLQYMSPEQAAGVKTITPSCDLFCFGSVLYEMLTGVPAFSGATYMELMARVTSMEPSSLAELRPDAPRGVVDLVAWMLEKDPDDRPSAAEVRDALELAGRGEVLVIAHGRKRARLVLVALALTAALLGVVAAARHQAVEPPPPAVVRTPAVAPSATPSSTPTPTDVAAARNAERRELFLAARELLDRKADSRSLIQGLRRCSVRPSDPPLDPATETACRDLVRAVVVEITQRDLPTQDLVELFGAAATLGVRLGRDPVMRQFRAFMGSRLIQLRGRELGVMFTAYTDLDLPLEFMGTFPPDAVQGLSNRASGRFLRLRNPAYNYQHAISSPRGELLKFLRTPDGQSLGPIARAHGLCLAAGVLDHSPQRQLALAQEARRLDPQSPSTLAAWSLALARNGHGKEALREMGAIVSTPMVFESYLIRSLRCWVHAALKDRKALAEELERFARAGASSRSIVVLRSETERLLRARAPQGE